MTTASRSLHRILALRKLEQEREEAALLLERQRRQKCLAAIARVEQEGRTAVQSQLEGLQSGDVSQTLSSEMVLAYSSWKNMQLGRAMQRHEEAVAHAMRAWQRARREKLQVETAWQESRRRDEEEAVRREQKLANDWYLSTACRRRALSTQEDWSVPRTAPVTEARNGASHATEMTA